MSLRQVEIQEGLVEGKVVRLACSECGRVYHEVPLIRPHQVYTIDFQHPIVPCHVGMVRFGSPSVDPFAAACRMLGVLPKVPTFRASVMMVDGMIVGYSLEGTS